MSATFTCEICGGTFGKVCTDEEMMSEARKVFGDVKLEDCGVVCDDCFNQIDPRQFEVD